MKKSITILQNVSTDEYFFSTDHCQQSKSKIKISDQFVPETIYIPLSIAPRKGFESGTIETKKDFIKFQEMYNYKLIQNPDPKFQA